MNTTKVVHHTAEARGCLIAVIATLGLATAILALIFGPLPSSRDQSNLPFDPQSDDSAMRFFLSHQEFFEQLRECVEQNKALVYYDLERDEATPVNALDQDVDRQAIRQLMKNLGLSALNGPASGWGVRMIFQSEGFVVAGSNKSFYFSLQTPPRLVPSIENFVIDAPESEGVFRNIAPNWYLKLDWGG